MERGVEAPERGEELRGRERLVSAGDEILGKQAQMNRLANQLGHVPDLQPMHQIKAMHLHRPNTHP